MAHADQDALDEYFAANTALVAAWKEEREASTRFADAQKAVSDALHARGEAAGRLLQSVTEEPTVSTPDL